jgi:hypothetical protein
MQHLISQDIKTIARRTLEEIFPRGDLLAPETAVASLAPSGRDP